MHIDSVCKLIAETERMTGCSEDPDPATGADAGDAAFRVVPVVTVHKENLDRVKSSIVSDIQVNNRIRLNIIM